MLIQTCQYSLWIAAVDAVAVVAAAAPATCTTEAEAAGGGTATATSAAPTTDSDDDFFCPLELRGHLTVATALRPEISREVAGIFLLLVLLDSSQGLP